MLADRKRIALAAGLVASLLALTPCGAAPKVSVGAPVPANRRVSMDRINHAAWDVLVQRYVDVSGKVDYRGWKQSASDVQALDRYLSVLAYADPNIRASQAAQLALWINAYNALTIKGILREYPTTSIRNHTARLYGYNIWHDLLLQVGQRRYSLNAIEHEILRKMGEPRIHFAIVCASRSCPRLLNEAYTAEKLEQQLSSNTRQFFANPANFRYDTARQYFYLSSILKWFADDFGADQAARLGYIARYLPSQAAYRAAQSNSVHVSYLSYDWRLNDQASLRSAPP